jgi:hypothetical protein
MADLATQTQALIKKGKGWQSFNSLMSPLSDLHAQGTSVQTTIDGLAPGNAFAPSTQSVSTLTDDANAFAAKFGPAVKKLIAASRSAVCRKGSTNKPISAGKKCSSGFHLVKVNWPS